MTRIPGASTRVGRLIRLPLRLVPSERPLPILFGTLRGKRWISTSGTHGCWLGTYERDLQFLLRANLRRGDVFFDIGANVGFFTLFGSSIVGRAGSVVAFEPLPRNLELLRRNLELNNIANVTIVPYGLADVDDTGYLSDSVSTSQAQLSGTGIPIQLATLDRVVATKRLRPPRAVKIDVEGAESRVLLGAKRLLSSARPLIFLSAHGREQHRRCWEQLLELGYCPELRRDEKDDGQYETVARHTKT